MLKASMAARLLGKINTPKKQKISQKNIRKAVRWPTERSEDIAKIRGALRGLTENLLQREVYEYWHKFSTLHGSHWLPVTESGLMDFERWVGATDTQKLKLEAEIRSSLWFMGYKNAWDDDPKDIT